MLTPNITSHVNLQRQVSGEMLTPNITSHVILQRQVSGEMLTPNITSHVKLQRQVSGEMLTPDHSRVILWTESLHLFLFRLNLYVTHTFHKSAELFKKRVQRDLFIGCTERLNLFKFNHGHSSSSCCSSAHTSDVSTHAADRVLNPVPPKPMLDGHEGSCQRLATPK